MNMNTEPENTMTAGPSPPPKTNTLGWTLPPLDEKPDLFSPTEDLRAWNTKAVNALGKVLTRALSDGNVASRLVEALDQAVMHGDLDTDALEAILLRFAEVGA